MFRSSPCLDLVGEGHDAAVVHLVHTRRLLAEVVVPRASDGLVNVAVGRRVEDLGQGHPAYRRRNRHRK